MNCSSRIWSRSVVTAVTWDGDHPNPNAFALLFPSHQLAADSSNLSARPSIPRIDSSPRESKVNPLGAHATLFPGIRGSRLYPHGPRWVRPVAAVAGRMGRRVPVPPSPVGVAVRFFQGTHGQVSLFFSYQWRFPRFCWGCFAGWGWRLETSRSSTFLLYFSVIQRLLFYTIVNLLMFWI
jgi:hypothetical protein